MERTCSLPEGLSVQSSLYPRMGPFGWLGGPQLTWTEVGDRATSRSDSTLLGTWTVDTQRTLSEHEAADTETVSITLIMDTEWLFF